MEQEQIATLTKEVARLRSILDAHGIDPDESAEFKAQFYCVPIGTMLKDALAMFHNGQRCPDINIDTRPVA